MEEGERNHHDGDVKAQRRDEVTVELIDKKYTHLGEQGKPVHESRSELAGAHTKPNAFE